VITLEHLRPRGSGRDLWRRLRSGRGWYWRPASVLMLAAIVGVLLALPPADATPAHGAKRAARPTLNVVVVGDFFSYGYAKSADPTLRLSVPPTLAALNQLQLANPDVQIRVLFIPVWESTWDDLYKSSGRGKPPLINAVKDANIVIAGVAADLPSFAASLQTALFGTRVPASMYSPLTGIFDNGSYQQEETAFLADVAAREAPGGVVVTLGYPLVQRVHLPSGAAWWSALSWGTISGHQAGLTNRLVTVLDADNATATRAAGTQYQDMHLLYADPSAMPSGASARGSQATALKKTLVANTLLPYVAQAVNDELTSKGVRGSADVSPVTPTSSWNLSVQMPTGAKAPVPPSHSGTGKRPTNTQASPANGHPGPVTIHVPGIPAPPAPIPKPIAPLALPRPVGTSTGGAPTSPDTASSSAGGTPPGNGTTSPGTSPSQPGTTSPGTSTSQPGTTSPGPGTTSPSGGTTTSPGSTSPSSGATSGGTSSGGGSGS
jgi:hypothetical protein